MDLLPSGYISVRKSLLYSWTSERRCTRSCKEIDKIMNCSISIGTIEEEVLTLKQLGKGRQTKVSEKTSEKQVLGFQFV